MMILVGRKTITFHIFFICGLEQKTFKQSQIYNNTAKNSIN